MNPSTLIIRFETVAEQAAGPVMRIVGFVKARELVPLFDAADLDANPRSAKAGPVTEGILESILETPEIFMFKTKGILIGSSCYERLQRSRYRLSFENIKIEGILDGGHNALAIGTHILVAATQTESIKRQVKRWPEFKEAWVENREAIEALRKAKDDEDGFDPEALDFLVPVEILVPSDVDDEDVVAEFNSSLLQICSARNNNVELTTETKANKKGFYEILQNSLPSEIGENVEWKTNDGGRIKVRDLIALSWIPLSSLDLPYIPRVAPQNVYRNKGECAKLFDELLADDRVSRPNDGEYTRIVFNKKIKSALAIAGEIPTLYDKIYMDFPYAYNNVDGRFGKINIVKMAKEMRSTPKSYFTGVDTEYSYPDGLIMPIVYGLQALMGLDEDGCVYWTHEPAEFLDNHLETIVKKYRLVLDAFRFDPQKIGKNEGSYDLVVDAFKTELLRMSVKG